MEQKRTLWIIAASGIFLLVVVGAALILYSPSLHKNQTQQAAFNPADGWTTPAFTTTTIPSDSFSTQTNDAFATNDISVPDFSGDTPAPASPFDTPAEESAVAKAEPVVPSTIQANNLTVYSDSTTVYGSGTTTIDLNALKSSAAVTPKNETTANQIANASSAKTTAKPATNTSATEYRYNYETPAPKTKAVAKAEPAKSTANTAKTSASKMTAKAVEKVPDRFWVQAAAYATKKNADDARATLESNKIPSEVFTYTDAKGKVFYRVRIGPYTTSSEAEYWKTQVAKIDQFAGVQSYIVNSSAKAVAR